MILQEILSLKWFQTCPYMVHTICLKKMLVKKIIVFTSIYFEPYCKIPARFNKSIPVFLHKIHIHVTGILNLCARTQANAWNDSAAVLTKHKQKVKVYTSLEEKKLAKNDNFFCQWRILLPTIFFNDDYFYRQLIFTNKYSCQHFFTNKNI